MLKIKKMFLQNTELLNYSPSQVINSELQSCLLKECDIKHRGIHRETTMSPGAAR